MKAFIRYMVKRLAYMLLTLFIIVTVTFFLMKLLPGTPFSNEDQLTAAQFKPSMLSMAWTSQFGFNMGVTCSIFSRET